MRKSGLQGHKGTLLEIGALIILNLGMSILLGYYLGNIADNIRIDSGTVGRGCRIIGWPFALQKHVVRVNGVPPYVYQETLYFPENAGRNAALFMGTILGLLLLIESSVFGINEWRQNRILKKKLGE